MFYIRWANIADERSKPFEKVTPFALRMGVSSLAKTFEAVYADIALRFRERVVEYGMSFQTLIGGTQWLETWNHQR